MLKRERQFLAKRGVVVAPKPLGCGSYGCVTGAVRGKPGWIAKVTSDASEASLFDTLAAVRAKGQNLPGFVRASKPVALPARGGKRFWLIQREDVRPVDEDQTPAGIRREAALNDRIQRVAELARDGRAIPARDRDLGLIHRSLVWLARHGYRVEDVHGQQVGVARSAWPGVRPRGSLVLYDGQLD